MSSTKESPQVRTGFHTLVTVAQDGQMTKEFLVVRIDEDELHVTLSLREGETGGTLPPMDIRIRQDRLPMPDADGIVRFTGTRTPIEGVFCGGIGYILDGFYEYAPEGRGRITIEVQLAHCDADAHDGPQTD